MVNLVYLPNKIESADSKPNTNETKKQKIKYTTSDIY